jgi:choline dehydrogenase-like flavoprotein
VKHLNVSWAYSFAASTKGSVNASFAGIKQDPMPKAWNETFENLGYPLTTSPFLGHSTGPYSAPSTVDAATTTRTYSANSYYLPVANRPNLTVYAHSIATRILLSEQDSTATGVVFQQENATRTIHADKEVILSAGALNSPKLLELSGIGDPNVLQAAGVNVKVANPHIGTNLQDHPLCGISFEAAPGVPTGDDLVRNNPEAIEQAMMLYKEHQAGPLASPGITSFGYLPTVDFVNDLQAKDAILQSLSDMKRDHPLDHARIEKLRRMLQEGKEGTGQYFLFPLQAAGAGNNSTSKLVPDPKPGNFISLVTALSHPLSSGTVHITSSDVSMPPKIDQRYLTNAVDLELQARHVRYLETMAAAAPICTLLNLGGKRNDERASFGGSLDKAKEYVQLASLTNWHYVGTCAMAPQEKGGVVGSDLRVYGVKGLRVVDASVIPLIPQSNTQSLVYVIAERASELIAEHWKET